MLYCTTLEKNGNNDIIKVGWCRLIENETVAQNCVEETRSTSIRQFLLFQTTPYRLYYELFRFFKNCVA